ncbi:MAG: DUF1778 domain-containing protein [Burkholderiales bacterium]|nr:DUF1778 domain-containing protein [Burkholderiales bacterium]
MKRIDSRRPVPPPHPASGKVTAQSLLDQELRVRLSQRDFAAFNTAIAGALAPNEGLQKALASAAKVPRA